MAALRTLEPRLAPDVAGALVTYGNGILDSYRFTDSLATAAQRHGTLLRIGTVTGIRHAARRVTGVLCAGAVIPCDAAVVAIGPWSQVAGSWLGRPLPVEPLKGEMLRMAVAGPPLACDVVAPNVSLFGRAGGQVWIGATMERRGFDTEPSESARGASVTSSTPPSSQDCQRGRPRDPHTPRQIGVHAAKVGMRGHTGGTIAGWCAPQLTCTSAPGLFIALGMACVQWNDTRRGRGYGGACGAGPRDSTLTTTSSGQLGSSALAALCSRGTAT